MTDSTRVPMRKLPPHEAIKTFDEVLLGYSREEAMAEARRALPFDLERSSARCPFDVDIRRFVGLMAEGDFDSALAVIREAHVWPEVFGRHCHKFCELPHIQRRGFVFEEGNPSHGVAAPFISALEWAAGTYGDRSRSPFRPGPPTGRRIAVVGAGSAGLACAWHARRRGHAVDIFEREAMTGGLLSTGYPPFRMNRQSVVRENDPTEWGASLYLNHPVGPDELRRLVDEYDAVFFSAGRSPIPSLGVEGDDLEGVLTGLDVLRSTWLGHPPDLGARVMIVGAGFTALDVARTAIRLGSSWVEMVYRRGVNEMLRPGLGQMFVRTLEEEGVRFRFMAEPARIIGERGRVVAVELVRTEYGEPDTSGRPSIEPVPGSEETLPVDTVLRCIGETIDAKALVEPLGIRLTERGFVEVDPVTRQTAHPKVWAGGDAIGTNGNEGAAYDAICAARAMDAFFEGRLGSWREEAAQAAKDMRWW